MTSTVGEGWIEKRNVKKKNEVRAWKIDAGVFYFYFLKVASWGSKTEAGGDQKLNTFFFGLREQETTFEIKKLEEDKSLCLKLKTQVRKISLKDLTRLKAYIALAEESRG